MKRYHHIGLPVEDQATPVPGEFWLEGGKLWLTNPDNHPQRVEWLRYAPDHAGEARFRDNPHICYEVDDVHAAVEGKTIVRPVGNMGNPPFALAAFTDEDGILVEYIQITGKRRWFDEPVDN
jgi:catechol 2,3-dioxygenase-like lactoylglutathione lyase family enzyme